MDSKRKISVLIVDDSNLIRQILRDFLSQCPEIGEISHATNGKAALPRMRYYKPDVVILDVHMPEMSGLETLAAIRQDFPEITVIMFSSHTQDGARITLQALELGADDFVHKPEFGADGNYIDFFANNLLPKIKGLAKRNKYTLTNETISPKKVDLENNKLPKIISASYKVCAIGISTGGPLALKEFFSLIKEKINGSILIVQHMPPIFTKQLAESLDQTSPVNVVEAINGIEIAANTAYIAPGGLHMMVKKNGDTYRIITLDTEPEENCKPSANILFRSVAEAYGSKAMAAIMTGMGQDGYFGIKSLKQAGAYILGQSSASCIVYGMPQRPIEEGLTDEVMDICGLSRKVAHLLTASRE